MRVESFSLNGETLHFEPPIETNGAPLHSLVDLAIAAVVDPESDPECQENDRAWVVAQLEPYEGVLITSAIALGDVLFDKHIVTIE